MYICKLNLLSVENNFKALRQFKILPLYLMSYNALNYVSGLRHFQDRVKTYELIVIHILKRF